MSWKREGKKLISSYQGKCRDDLRQGLPSIPHNVFQGYIFYVEIPLLRGEYQGCSRPRQDPLRDSGDPLESFRVREAWNSLEVCRS